MTTRAAVTPKAAPTQARKRGRPSKRTNEASTSRDVEVSNRPVTVPRTTRTRNTRVASPEIEEEMDVYIHEDESSQSDSSDEDEAPPTYTRRRGKEPVREESPPPPHHHDQSSDEELDDPFEENRPEVAHRDHEDTDEEDQIGLDMLR